MDTPTRIDWLPALLQNNDSFFPTGAYAHSAGLEEVVRLGVVTDEATLQAFLQEQVIPMLQNLELPYVAAAHACGLEGDLEGLARLSGEISAWKLGREAREASAQIGRARLHAAREVFPHPLLDALAASALAKHQIIVYGWQMAVAEVPLAVALTGYSYQTLAGIGSAALKLIRIGQQGVQRVLRGALAETETGVAAACAIKSNEAGWFSPMLEIAAMRHERAEERLFIS